MPWAFNSAKKCTIFKYKSSWRRLNVFHSFLKVSSQPCPPGQQGDATWLCGTDGDWVGLPDLSQCRVLNTDAVIDELKVKSNALEWAILLFLVLTTHDDLKQ